MENYSPELQKLREQVESGACTYLDSYFSPQTRRLITKFSANGVDMTDLWIRTPPFWSCPACGRSKENIVRLNVRNQLICRLVEHHDHMKDLMLERFRSISASLDLVVADEMAEKFAKRSASMVSSYDNTVICDDCNASDAKAKKLVNAHAKYSFSANEIRQFVIAKSNKPHDVDTSIASKIWEESKYTFLLRLKIVDRIAEIAATNKHWYQYVESKDLPNTIISCSNHIFNQFGVRADEAYSLLRGKSVKIMKDYSAWRKKKPTISKFPTQGEIHHAAQVNSAPFWKRVDDDWQCPVCKRTKVEAVRINNKSEWCFSLSSGWYKDLSEPNNKKHHTLCVDCGWVAHRLAEEAMSIAGKKFDQHNIWVELDDIASVIIPRPHIRHEIKNSEADLVVSSIAAYMTEL